MQHLNTVQLLNQAQLGNALAIEQLLSHYRSRLCRIISILLDPRLSARVDPADIVQDALLRAAIGLPSYLEHRPIDFYPWLKSLVKDELIRVHRQHLHAQRRSVCREHQTFRQFSTGSRMRLAKQFVGRGPSPSQHAIAQEHRILVRQVLNWLNDSDRKILIMRYEQQMNHRAIGKALKIGESAAKSRLWRAQKVATRLLRPSLAWLQETSRS